MNQLERTFGSCAIPHLTRWIVLFNALGYIAINLNREIASLLVFEPGRVLQGEVWRLFTYLFIPPNLSPIWIIFALQMIYVIGEGLEQEWGAFRLNLYYLIGMFSTTLIGFLCNSGVDNTYLNTSLFLAFATLYPDFEVFLFFILPVKMKWLGILSALILVYQIIMGPFYIKAAVLISLGNYFLFFSKSIWSNFLLRQQAARGRARFQKATHSEETSFHSCTVCKKTENSHPEIVFRIAKDGNEYCLEHLPAKEAAAC